MERDNWIARRLPTSLIEYPFETALGAWGIVSSVQILFDVVSPSIADLPRPLPGVWSFLMACAGIYIFVGLYRHAYETLLASGIALLGWVCAAYGVAIIAYTTDWRRSVMVITLMFVIASVCWSRAWFLRARATLLTKMADGAAKDG